jgi:hypothetical protein
MNQRPPAMHYEAAAHAEGFELEVLADLASHEYDDLEKYCPPEPALASPGWRRADAHPPPTSGTCNSSNELCYCFRHRVPEKAL